MNCDQNIGEIIRKHRKSLRLTVSELSRMSGVSTTHLGRIEIGQRVPSARVLQSVAEHLGLRPNELLILAGYLSPEPSVLPKEQSNVLLLERVVFDTLRLADRKSMFLTL